MIRVMRGSAPVGTVQDSKYVRRQAERMGLEVESANEGPDLTDLILRARGVTKVYARAIVDSGGGIDVSILSTWDPVLRDMERLEAFTPGGPGLVEARPPSRPDATRQSFEVTAMVEGDIAHTDGDFLGEHIASWVKAHLVYPMTMYIMEGGEPTFATVQGKGEMVLLRDAGWQVAWPLPRDTTWENDRDRPFLAWARDPRDPMPEEFSASLLPEAHRAHAWALGMGRPSALVHTFPITWAVWAESRDQAIAEAIDATKEAFCE